MKPRFNPTQPAHSHAGDADHWWCLFCRIEVWRYFDAHGQWLRWQVFGGGVDDDRLEGALPRCPGPVGP